jgi:hypothetical protein
MSVSSIDFDMSNTSMMSIDSVLCVTVRYVSGRASATASATMASTRRTPGTSDSHASAPRDPTRPTCVKPIAAARRRRSWNATSPTSRPPRASQAAFGERHLISSTPWFERR